MFSFPIISQENWEFKTDKRIHFGAGVVIAIPSYYLIYNVTNDHEISRNAAWIIPVFAAIGKEGFDWTRGKEISLADFSYTLAGAIVTTFIITRIQKWKQKKWRKKFELYD